MGMLGLWHDIFCLFKMDRRLSFLKKKIADNALVAVQNPAFVEVVEKSGYSIFY
jgi:hypothetical protein